MIRLYFFIIAIITLNFATANTILYQGFENTQQLPTETPQWESEWERSSLSLVKSSHNGVTPYKGSNLFAFAGTTSQRLVSKHFSKTSNNVRVSFWVYDVAMSQTDQIKVLLTEKLTNGSFVEIIELNVINKEDIKPGSWNKFEAVIPVQYYGGTYKISWEAQNVLIDEIKAVEDIATDVNTLNMSSIKVYPNPAVDGNVNILFPQAAPRSISLIDMTGKVVYSSNSNGRSESISLIDLKPGVYFIQVIVNGEVHTERILVK